MMSGHLLFPLYAVINIPHISCYNDGRLIASAATAIQSDMRRKSMRPVCPSIALFFSGLQSSSRQICHIDIYIRMGL